MHVIYAHVPHFKISTVLKLLTLQEQYLGHKNNKANTQNQKLYSEVNFFQNLEFSLM